MPESSASPSALLCLAARESVPCSAMNPLWRVRAGALRLDSAPPGQASRFVRLALPGDVVGVEQWAGTGDQTSARALMACTLQPLQAQGADMMHILMETVVAAHQRCREVVTLRTGTVAQRIQTLLLMFAQQAASTPGAQAAECPVPHLSDLGDIIDAAPETVSRVFGSMRELDFLQDRKPQKARFDSQALRSLEMVAGMSAVRSTRKLHLAAA